MSYHTKSEDKLPICPTVGSPPSVIYIQRKCGTLNNTNLKTWKTIVIHTKLIFFKIIYRL